MDYDEVAIRALARVVYHAEVLDGLLRVTGTAQQEEGLRKKQKRRHDRSQRLHLILQIRGRPCVARTRDQRIKSPLLYQLS